MDRTRGSSELPILVDESIDQVRSALGRVDGPKLGAAAALEVASRAKSQITSPSQLLEGAHAADYLRELITSVQEQIIGRHSAYTAVRWLWYLRRTPREIFRGSYQTTLGYDRLLAESLCWYMPGELGGVTNDRLLYKIDDSAARQICRYIVCVKYLATLHIQYRRVGKGAVLDTSGVLTQCTTLPETEKYIRLYDERHEHGSGFAGHRLGIASRSPSFGNTKKSIDGDLGVMLTFEASEPVRTPIEYPVNGVLRSVNVNARHILKEISLQELIAPLGIQTEQALPFIHDIFPIVVLLIAIIFLIGKFPSVLVNILHQGYFLMPEQRFRSVYEEIEGEVYDYLSNLIPDTPRPTNYLEWVENLENLAPSLWPLRPGGPLRRCQFTMLIDVTAASRALLDRQAIDRSSEFGNLRGAAFETQCQEIIDGSVWVPPIHLRELRGRTLRRNGAALTDIDAIAVKNGIAIIFSCKSLVYDSEYDKGTYSTVRNAQHTVEAAVKRWELIVQDLRANPVGDNFNLSDCTELHGVVCTPFVVFTSSLDAIKELYDGLRACISSGELQEWLNLQAGEQRSDRLVAS